MCTNKCAYMCFSGIQTRGIVINKSTVFTVTTSKPFILLLVFFFLFERSTSKCLSQSYEIVDLEWSVYWHSKRGRINFTFPHIRAVSSHDPVLHTIRWEEIELRTKPSLMAYAPWKEAIIKVKWADAERKSIFFCHNKCGFEFNTSGRGTLSKWPSSSHHFYSML